MTLCFLAITICGFAQDPNPSFTITGNCQNQSITFTSTSNTPVGSITKEHWYFGTGNAADTFNGNVANFAFPSSGSYFVQLTVTNSLGNSETTSQNLRVEPTPEPVIDKTVPCFPNAITLKDFSNVSDGSITSRTWSLGGATSPMQTISYSPPLQGSYPIQLDIVSDKGCAASISETLEYGAKPNLIFTPTSPMNLCDGDSVLLSVDGAKTYEWFDMSTNTSITVNQSGTYKVVGFTGNACSSEDSIIVNTVPKPIANAGDDVAINLGQKTILQGSGGVNYSWTPADFLSDEFAQNPEASPNRSTSYILTVLDINGCRDTDTVEVTVDINSTIPVHNMLTPNGDGYNDKWDLTNVPGIETASVHVFNRWGWEVYKSDDYKHDWEGTYNDEPLADGSYVYIIKFAEEGKTPLRGAIEILRNIQK